MFLPAPDSIRGITITFPLQREGYGNLHAHTDQDEAMTIQGIAAVPPSGDSLAEQSSLIRNFLYAKSCAGAWVRRSCRSERKGSVPSSLLSSSPRSRSSRRSRSPPSSCRNRSRSRCSFRLAPPTFREAANVPLRCCRGFRWWSRIGPALGYRQPSASD